MSTVALDCESRPIARNTSCIAGAWPRISFGSNTVSTACVSRLLSSSARRISSTAWSTSNGLGRYSYAPPWNAATAESRSEYAVITMTGTAGWRCFTAFRSSRPDSPGIRISDTSTSGESSESASSASCAEENELKAMPSRLSAFSITQRIDRSSSTIQTGFM